MLYFFREQRKFGAPQFQSVRSVSSLSSLCPLVMTTAIFLTLTSNIELGRLIFFSCVSSSCYSSLVFPCYSHKQTSALRVGLRFGVKSTNNSCQENYNYFF